VTCETLSNDVCFLLGNCVEGVSKICLRLKLGNPLYTSLRKGDSHLKHDSLTSTIPWLTRTRALSRSHTHPWPPCGVLPSTACFSTRTLPSPVTLLPIGSGYFRAKPFSRINTPTFSTPVILHTYLPMTVEQTQCSETLAYKNSDAGKLPRGRHTTFRARRKFEIKNYEVTFMSAV